MDRIVFDIEGNGLQPTKLHCLYQHNLTTGKESVHTNDYDVWEEPTYLIGHNIIRYDCPVLRKLHNIDLSKHVLIDTLALSWYLFPTRARHGLEDWGVELGVPKVKIDDWDSLSQEEYIERCRVDVHINTMLWEKCWKKLLSIYDSGERALGLIKYLGFKMHSAMLAEQNKWRLDIPQTRSNLANLLWERRGYLKGLKENMPRVPIMVKRNKPKTMVTKDNKLSKRGEQWLGLCRAEGVHPNVESLEIISKYSDPNPGSSKQVKDWLFSLGWKPTAFNKGKNGDVPQVSVDGNVCPSVLKLAEEYEAIRQLSDINVLTHRIGILKGFLRNEQDGFLHASVAGFTNTLRFRHSVLVNLPSISAKYGEYIRPCLIAPDGYELVGSDMSSLEDRTKQHYMFKHDPDYVKEMNVPGFDPHLDIAVVAGLMSQRDSDDYKNDIRVHELKPIRHSAKTTNYSCTYGAYPPKIASSAGIPLDEAKVLWETYWKRNWSIEAIAEEQYVKEVGDEHWLFNPVSGLYYNLRFEKDRFSTLNQGTGSYCFDIWLGFVLRETESLIGQFHDEHIFLIKKGNREYAEKILRQAIEKTNKVLKLNRDMDIDVQFGNNYGEIH